MNGRPAYFDAVRDELVAAAARQRSGDGATEAVGVGRAQRLPWLVAAAAALALVFGIAFVALDTDGVEASGIDVIHTDTGLRIRFLDVDHSPAALQRELDELGIATRVVGVPTGPSGVGRVLSVETPIDLPDDGFRPDLANGYIELDEGFSGELDISVGIPAAPGEPYVANADAFVEGERLHCVVQPGDRADDAGAAIAALAPPLTASWISTAGGGATTLADVLAVDPDAVVLSATAQSSDSVVLAVGAPDDVFLPAAGLLSYERGVSGRSGPNERYSS